MKNSYLNSIRELKKEIVEAMTKNMRIVNGFFLMLFIGTTSESFSFSPIKNTIYIVFVCNLYILILGYLCNYTQKSKMTKKLLVIDLMVFSLLLFYIDDFFAIYLIGYLILFFFNILNAGKLKF